VCVHTSVAVNIPLPILSLFLPLMGLIGRIPPINKVDEPRLSPRIRRTNKTQMSSGGLYNYADVCVCVCECVCVCGFVGVGA